MCGSQSYFKLLFPRTQAWQGPAQIVHLRPGARYNLRAFIKLINAGNKDFQRFDFEAAYQWTSDCKYSRAQIDW